MDGKNTKVIIMPLCMWSKSIIIVMLTYIYIYRVSFRMFVKGGGGEENSSTSMNIFEKACIPETI